MEEEELLWESIYSSSSSSSIKSGFDSVVTSPDPTNYQTPCYSTPSPPPRNSHYMTVPHHRMSLVAKSCSLPSDCPLQRLAQLDDVEECDGGSALELTGSPVSTPFGGAGAPACGVGSSSAAPSESASISALIVTPPSPDSFRRAHRHSIPGHRLNNYLKFLNELAAKGSSTAHLFSTAVISGSSSAPNLKEMPQPREGLGLSVGFPNIRPLETLHNALSLRQLDFFLEYATSANFKTPCQSPPRLIPRIKASGLPAAPGQQENCYGGRWVGAPSYIANCESSQAVHDLYNRIILIHQNQQLQEQKQQQQQQLQEQKQQQQQQLQEQKQHQQQKQLQKQLLEQQKQQHPKDKQPRHEHKRQRSHER